jgi:hypothetical protein
MHVSGRAAPGHHPPQAAREARQNAKGDRHCCQSPCHRTSASHPEGPVAWFRRHAPLAPARACELRVGRRGRLIATLPRKRASFPALAARFMTSPEGGTIKPCWIRFPEQSIGFGSRLRGAQSPGLHSSGRSLRRSAACAGLSPSVSSIRQILRFDQHLRISFRIWFSPASASPGTATTLAHRLASVTTVAFVSPSRPRWFPEGTCTRPIRVSSCFCFGFPLPIRLLTSLKVSPIASRSKGEMIALACG